MRPQNGKCQMCFRVHINWWHPTSIVVCMCNIFPTMDKTLLGLCWLSQFNQPVFKIFPSRPVANYSAYSPKLWRREWQIKVAPALKQGMKDERKTSKLMRHLFQLVSRNKTYSATAVSSITMPRQLANWNMCVWKVDRSVTRMKMQEFSHFEKKEQIISRMQPRQNEYERWAEDDGLDSPLPVRSIKHGLHF